MDGTGRISEPVRLPPELPSELEDAVIRLDLDAITELIDKIRKHDLILADTLSGFAENFDYDNMLKVIQSSTRK